MSVETAAETAAKIFETNRIQESTNAAVSKACEEVGVVFASDDARIQAAALIANGIPDGVTPEAARRLVSMSLKEPVLRQFLKNEPEPGSFESIKAAFDARRAGVSPKPVSLQPPKPATLEEIGAAIRARRSPGLYPKPEPQA